MANTVKVTLPHDKHSAGLMNIFHALGGVNVPSTSAIFNYTDWEFPAETATRARDILNEYIAAYDGPNRSFARWDVQDKYERELGVSTYAETIAAAPRHAIQLWEDCDNCGGNPCYCFDDAPLTGGNEIYGGDS